MCPNCGKAHAPQVKTCPAVDCSAGGKIEYVQLGDRRFRKANA
jgi:uncharacterized OB-fold protein